MRHLITSIGPFGLKPMRNRFRTLVRSIVSQQISTKAAASILGKLEALVEPDGGLSPESILRLSVAKMRKVGLSPQKQTYLHDLAEHVHQRKVRLDRLGRLPDEEVIAELIQVKGIGRWTAQMFLIFALGRLDVFPHDDLVSVAARLQAASTASTNCPTKKRPTASQSPGGPTQRSQAGTAGEVWLFPKIRPDLR